MLEVKQYGGQQVSTRTGRSASANDAGRGAFNNPLEQLAPAAARVVSDIQAKTAELEASDALTRFEREKNDIFFKPGEGYFNTQGRDAIDKSSETYTRLEKLREQYASSLSPVARDAFNRAASQQITRAQVDISTHAQRGLSAWEKASQEARVENSIENASFYWNDPKRMTAQRILGEEALLEESQRAGLPPEATAEKLQTFRSKFGLGAIESAASTGGYAAAKQAFDNYSDLLEGPDYVRAQSFLTKAQEAQRTAESAGVAVATASRLVDTHRNSENPRTAILEAAAEIEDPELRKSVIKEATYQLDEFMKAETERKANLYIEAQRFIADGQGTVEQFKSLRPQDWNDLTPKQQKALSSDAPIVNNYATYSRLVNMPMDQLAGVNPLDYVTELDEKHLNKLQTAVAAARKGAQDGVATRDQRKAQRIQDMLGTRTPSGKTEIKRYNAMSRLLDTMIDDAQRSLGKDFLTEKEFDAVMSDFSRKVIKERDYWFDSKKDVTAIDADKMDAYSNYLRKNNIPVTTENLLILDGNKAHRESALKGL